MTHFTKPLISQGFFVRRRAKSRLAVVDLGEGASGRASAGSPSTPPWKPATSRLSYFVGDEGLVGTIVVALRSSNAQARGQL